jgi:teichuronic acid biosynthesis glycosyltransferase TuaG
LSKGLSSNKLGLIKYNYAIYKTHLKYSTLKSSWMLLRFFYEQFFVKSKMLTKAV